MDQPVQSHIFIQHFSKHLLNLATLMHISTVLLNATKIKNIKRDKKIKITFCYVNQTVLSTMRHQKIFNVTKDRDLQICFA